MNVTVKPLKWEKDWGGSNDDIPCWRGHNSVGMYIRISFAGDPTIKTHDDVSPGELEEKKNMAEAVYRQRVLAAISIDGTES